jgi:hypothetical protein
MFKELCGKDSFKSVILATTMWDDIDELTGSQRENELMNNYWKSMIKLGSRLVRFHNTKESAWDIIGQFTGIRQPLQLQVEMIEEGKPSSETAAGSVIVLHHWLKAPIVRIRQLIKNIRYRPKKASKDESEASALVEEELVTVDGQEQFDAAATGKMATDQASRSSSPSTQQDSIFSSLVDPTLSRSDTRSTDSTLLKSINYRSRKVSKDEGEASTLVVEERNKLTTIHQLVQASEQRNKMRGRQKQRRFSTSTSANMIMSRSDTQSTNSSLLDPASVQEGMESPPLEFHNKRLAATITALRHAKDIADAALVPGLRGITSLALTVAEAIAVKIHLVAEKHALIMASDSR